jgi:undecaprenyl-diphosphatase
MWFENMMLAIRTPLMVRVFEAVTFFGEPTTIVGFALKDLVRRARPDGLIPAIRETGFSFPSGHATGSMAFYGFTAFILCRLYPRYAKAVVTIAAVIILTIGMSRLYLGVHFPSDVVGGYLVGGLWLFIGIKAVQRRSTPK